MSTYVLQLLSGLGEAAVLFLVASGLTLIFGALRIANFAHGSLYMIGAFVSVTLADSIGFGNGSFWATLLLSAVLVVGLGIVMEVVVLRRIYQHSLLTQLLVTFAFVLIIEGAIRKIYGPEPKVTKTPPFLKGAVDVLGRAFPIYQLFLMGLALAVAVALWALLYRTGLGATIRAAVSDPQLLNLSGRNVALLFTGVFAIGCFFAGLAGSAVAPLGSVGLGIDISVILKAFVIVVIGGLGSLGGALVGSVLVGIADAFGILWVPQASLAVVFGVLVVVLAVRPQGLFGNPTALIEVTSTQKPSGFDVGRFLGRFYRVPAASSRLVDRGLRAFAGVAVVVLAVVPLLFNPETVLLMGEALILALFALSLNLLVGTAGLMSFGHAAFYGFGSYTVALLVTDEGWPPIAAFVVAPIVGAVAAFVSGLVALRGRQLFFGLLTLGVSQVYWAAAQGWLHLTGGDNGLPGIYNPSWLPTTDDQYWFLFGVVLACALLLWVITRSPFGDALRGIRENRRRAEFTGLPVKRYELGAFVIAGMFAAVAGALAAMWAGLASSADFDWRNSAAPMIVSLIGGIGHFLGPAGGAIFYVFLQDYMVRKTVLWDLAIGVVVLFVALVMPSGLTGALRWLFSTFGGLVERAPAAVELAPARGEAGVVHLPEPVPPCAAAAAGNGAGPPILTIEGLRKSFGGLVAVEDVSLSVRRGTMHAIIGPNGAGKTTVFNLITGLLRPDTGRIVFEGHELDGASPWRVVKHGMGRSFQQATLFWALSSFENVLIAEAAARGATRRLYGTHTAPARAHVSELLDQVGLSEFASVPASSLSHGDQRSLELAAALAIDARLLLLDEPTAGLSPSETKTAVRLIERIAREQGLTVLFIEHDMEVVFGVADRITVLHRGSVLAEGSPDEIRSNEDVRRAYLGEVEEEVATPA